MWMSMTTSELTAYMLKTKLTLTRLLMAQTNQLAASALLRFKHFDGRARLPVLQYPVRL